MLAAGTNLGPYKIVSPLGAGGMGEVYRARDTRLGRDVAIKVIRAEVARDPDRIKRFEQEARAAGALSHPNVCAIYDIGTHEGSPFVVMELLEGESLREKLRAGPLPVRKAIDYAAQTAHGLAAAHEKGIIHRDLKPENLFVTKDGRVKVLDFGLAKLTRPDMVAAAGEPTVSIAATETGAILGTVGYMSPEQVRGENADARSDLFALGAILYEMLTGKRAFQGASYVETLNAILKEEPAPLAASGHDIPAAIGPIVRRCLEKNPAERFQSASDLAFNLESAGLGQGQLQGAPAAEPRPLHRRGLAWVAAISLVALTMIGAGLAWRPLSHLLGSHEPSVPQKKEWILVAEFEGPRDEPDVARAAQGLTAVALDQSGIVMTVPRDQLSVALEQAGRPDTMRVDGPLARELAYRNGIRAVLEGRVSQVGTGYSVVLRLSDSGNDSTLITVNGSARDGNALIRTVDQLARRLRRELGENPTAVQATRRLNVNITPSFDAYRKLERAEIYWSETGDATGSIRLVREALDLDPDCAIAYMQLDTYFSAQGKADSAVWAVEQALKRPKRLTEEQRLFAEASRCFDKADLDGALVMLNRQLKLFPTGSLAGAAYDSRRILNAWDRRFPQALEDARRGAEASPFDPGQMALAGRASLEIAAGQLDRAEQTLRQLQGMFRHILALRLAVARDDWVKAESLSVTPAADVAADFRVHQESARIEIALHARRGEVRAAQECIARELSAARLRRVWVTPPLVLAMVSGTPVPGVSPVLAADTTAAGVINRSWRAALAGDLPVARRELAALRRRSADDLKRAGPAQDFLDALVLTSEKRWGDAVRALGPVAMRGDDFVEPLQWGRIGVTPERWLVAEAYEHMGPPDSAAAAFERVLEPPESQGVVFFPPYAHQRLVMIYARMGRREEAERHWQAFSSVFVNPDPEVRHLLDDARAAIQGLRGMARPERPRT
jgi:tetratricopeptide (TPR) repeat protein